MKIIQVCTSKGDFRGGAERFCLNLSRSLAITDHDVTLVTGNRRLSTCLHLPFTFRTIPEMKSVLARKVAFDYLNPFAAHNFKKIIEEIKPNIIHFHSFYGLSTSLVKVSTRQYPTLITLHDSWPAFVDGAIVTPRLGLSNSCIKIPLGYLHRRINRLLLEEAILVSPSLWLKKYFETLNFQSPHHIPNGIEGVDPGTTYQKTILWVGELTAFKGLPTIIHILSEISIELNWKLIIVGDGPYKRELKTKYPHIHFVGHCDPGPFYREASILVTSSLGYDNFPTVVLEGMQHGLCIVAHGRGGTAEMLQNNTTGILYKSVDSLKEILASLLDNPERIRELGGSAKHVFNDKYRWETCFNHYLNLYATMTSGGYVHRQPY